MGAFVRLAPLRDHAGMAFDLFVPNDIRSGFGDEYGAGNV